MLHQSAKLLQACTNPAERYRPKYLYCDGRQSLGSGTFPLQFSVPGLASVQSNQTMANGILTSCRLLPASNSSAC